MWGALKKETTWERKVVEALVRKKGSGCEEGDVEAEDS